MDVPIDHCHGGGSFRHQEIPGNGSTLANGQEYTCETDLIRNSGMLKVDVNGIVLLPMMNFILMMVVMVIHENDEAMCSQKVLPFGCWDHQGCPMALVHSFLSISYVYHQWQHFRRTLDGGVNGFDIWWYLHGYPVEDCNTSGSPGKIPDCTFRRFPGIKRDAKTS